MSQIDLATFLRAEAEMAAEVYSDESVPQKLIDAADEIQRLRDALREIIAPYVDLPVQKWNGEALIAQEALTTSQQRSDD